MLEASEETEHQQLLAQTCLCASHLAKMETERHPGFVSHVAQDKAVPAALWPCRGATPACGWAERGAGPRPPWRHPVLRHPGVRGGVGAGRAHAAVPRGCRHVGYCHGSCDKGVRGIDSSGLLAASPECPRPAPQPVRGRGRRGGRGSGRGRTRVAGPIPPPPNTAVPRVAAGLRLREEGPGAVRGSTRGRVCVCESRGRAWCVCACPAVCAWGDPGAAGGARGEDGGGGAVVEAAVAGLPARCRRSAELRRGPGQPRSRRSAAPAPQRACPGPPGAGEANRERTAAAEGLSAGSAVLMSLRILFILHRALFDV